MSEIIINDEQAKILEETAEEVLVRDRRGNLIARIPPRLSADDVQIVALAQRRLASKQARYTTTEVLQHLNSLDPS